MNGEEYTRELLKAALSVSVPLLIWEYRDVPIDELLALAPEVSQYIAEHGDMVLYKSKKKGETAKAFNNVARGLAILAHAPGGVKFLGLHFEAKPRGT